MNDTLCFFSSIPATDFVGLYYLVSRMITMDMAMATSEEETGNLRRLIQSVGEGGCDTLLHFGGEQRGWTDMDF